MLKKRRLGNTSLYVSEIGLGCWQLGGITTINGIGISSGNVDENSAKEIIDTAIENGVNTFDTADFYSLGNSEKRLGKYLAERRSDINLFTKAGSVPIYDQFNPVSVDLSYNHLIASLDRSLKRLRTDYVDLFQTHYAPLSEKEFISIEQAFKKIKSDGKARYCGVSLGSESCNIGIELIERNMVDSLQIYFSLLHFEPTKKLLGFAKKNGVGIIVAEPLAKGFLTGKFTETTNFPQTDVRSRFSKDEITKMVVNSQKFNFLVNESRSLSQVALAYILNRNEVSTCIPGATSSDQIKSNIKSSNIMLNSNEIEQIQQIQHDFE